MYLLMVLQQQNVWCSHFPKQYCDLFICRAASIRSNGAHERLIQNVLCHIKLIVYFYFGYNRHEKKFMNALFSMERIEFNEKHIEIVDKFSWLIRMKWVDGALCYQIGGEIFLTYARCLTKLIEHQHHYEIYGASAYTQLVNSPTLTVLCASEGKAFKYHAKGTFSVLLFIFTTRWMWTSNFQLWRSHRLA